MREQAKQFCKDYKLKFEKITASGNLLCSELIPLKAGMKKNLITGRYIPGKYKIHTIGKRRRFYLYDYRNVQLLNSSYQKERVIPG